MSTILADGDATKAIGFVIAVLFVVLHAAFGKSKKTAGAPAPRPVQQQRAAPPPMPAKQRSRGKAKPQAVTVQQAALLAQQAAANAQPRRSAPKPVVVAPVTRATPRNAPSETARNLKLLLQRGGVREAVLLTEILGPPLSMRE